jgi:hypothetical protein
MSVPSKTLTALAASALLVSFAGTARAQTPYSSDSSPARDIPASCRNVERLADGYVSAECEAGGGWRWSALRPTDCRTSISNRDGVLTCTGARATVGALYPDSGGYGGQVTTLQPDGIIGALFGTVFGNAYSNERQIEDDYSNGRRPLGGQRVTFNNRVDAALRDRRISRTAANRLRTDFDALVRIETGYQRDGLSDREQQDLETRYADLNRRVGDDYISGNGGGYGNDARANQIEARISAGERNGSISRTEASRLRTELADLSSRWAGLEARVQIR